MKVVFGICCHFFSEAVVSNLDLWGDGLQIQYAFVCVVFMKSYGLHDG